MPLMRFIVMIVILLAPPLNYWRAVLAGHAVKP